MAPTAPGGIDVLVRQVVRAVAGRRDLTCSSSKRNRLVIAGCVAAGWTWISS